MRKHKVVFLVLLVMPKEFLKRLFFGEILN